jgi:hypothetical protein
LVSQPTAISLSNISTQVSCYGGTNGAIDISISGGTSPYTYNWGGGISTQDRSSLY